MPGRRGGSRRQACEARGGATSRREGRSVQCVLSSVVAGARAVLCSRVRSPPRRSRRRSRVGAPATAEPVRPRASTWRRQPRPRPVARPPAARLTEQAHKDRINAWTVGLAAGRMEGAPILFASELARVLDDGDNMRVLPIVTRGPFDNVYDLLYLRGVDAAIVYGDVLDHFKSKPEFANAWRRINYLVNLFPSEAHVFVRPEIRSLQDLAGKVVNFNTQGTAAAYSGPIIFKQLGIDVKATFIPHSVAMGKMKEGEEVAATFWISSKPLAPFLKGKFPEGFKFLPIEYSDKLEYYAPAYLEHADYPALIPQGSRSPPSRCRPCSPSTTGPRTPTATSASSASSTICSSASRSCRRSRATTRNGRT